MILTFSTCLVSNHDVNIYEGTLQELFGRQEGSTATFVVAAYMKGVPMIYNGHEIGYPEGTDFFTPTPIDWSKADPEVLAELKGSLLSIEIARRFEEES